MTDIVKIESRFENSKTGLSIWKIGTGWLIRSDLLVTAGDVVYDTEYQLGGATQVKCYIGYRGRTSPENSQIQPRYGRRVVTSSEWIDEVATSSRDIAFIQKDANSVCSTEEPAPVVPETEEKVSLTVTHCSSCGETCSDSGVVPVEEPVVQEEVKPDDAPFITPSVNIETEFEIIPKEPPVASDTTSEVEDIAPVVETVVEAVEASTTTSEFYEVLKTVASIDTESDNAASPLLGSDSSSASVSAGALLSYVVGADTISSTAPTKIHGAAERALLAEASLQAVLAIEESAELDEILNHMEQNWNENAPKVDEAAALLLPYLKDSAKGVAFFDPADNEKVTQLAKRKHLPIGNLHVVGADGVGKDFITGLFGPTRPLHGKKEVFNSLAPVLKGGVEAIEQLVSRSGKAAVADWIPKLLETAAARSTTLAPMSTGPDYEAARILLQRAIMADAALQAIAGLSQQKLQAVKLLALNSEHVDEDIFDFIKRLIQEIGPLAVSPAKHAVKKFVRLFIDAPPKPQPVEQVSIKPAPGKLVLRQLLRENKTPARVSND
ncbi:hypothetical protein EDB81DRAFT_683885 [Dactylonectria macrodidyma]|uniref:Uncharacterized protein n=1 Tax=Dactylonectria macrodidyma TaxID=307937 RepID=A0A9P9FGH6_9HYPO|nr:hypothetical protein EDB81DRAFT_683885 [Dactylonectria macrodidyma]